MANKARREENSIDRIVGLFDTADAVLIERMEGGAVTMKSAISAFPCDSKTGEAWTGMTLITSLEEAVKSKHKLGLVKKDEPLAAFLTKHRKCKPKQGGK